MEQETMFLPHVFRRWDRHAVGRHVKRREAAARSDELREWLLLH